MGTRVISSGWKKVEPLSRSFVGDPLDSKAEPTNLTVNGNRVARRQKKVLIIS
jgi:hypothetical protein